MVAVEGDPVEAIDAARRQFACTSVEMQCHGMSKKALFDRLEGEGSVLLLEGGPAAGMMVHVGRRMSCPGGPVPVLAVPLKRPTLAGIALKARISWRTQRWQDAVVSVHEDDVGAAIRFALWPPLVLWGEAPYGLREAELGIRISIPLCRGGQEEERLVLVFEMRELKKGTTVFTNLHLSGTSVALVHTVHTHPLRNRCAPMAEALHLFAAHSAARVIQAAWRTVVSDPRHPACRRRLAREFDEMAMGCAGGCGPPPSGPGGA